MRRFLQFSQYTLWFRKSMMDLCEAIDYLQKKHQDHERQIHHHPDIAGLLIQACAIQAGPPEEQEVLLGPIGYQVF
jgi:hypothetical protein